MNRRNSIMPKILAPPTLYLLGSQIVFGADYDISGPHRKERNRTVLQMLVRGLFYHYSKACEGLNTVALEIQNRFVDHFGSIDSPAFLQWRERKSDDDLELVDPNQTLWSHLQIPMRKRHPVLALSILERFLGSIGQPEKNRGLNLSYRWLELVKQLLELDADPDIAPARPGTALTTAIDGGNRPDVSICRMLMAAELKSTLSLSRRESGTKVHLSK